VAAISIDRINLAVSGITPGEAERLAGLIAQKLGAAAARVGGAGAQSSMEVALPAAGGASADTLAEQVVEDLVRQLNRTL
jgi:hypothetical protein